MLAPTTRPVVVGIDDEGTSHAALDWAIDETRRRRLPLHIVHARQLPAGGRASLGDQVNDDQASAAVLSAAVARVQALAPNVTVTTESPLLRPSVALIDASGHAECVVVGTRDRGSLTGALLGSTSLNLAAHAHSPVVLVRPRTDVPAGRPSVVVGADGSATSAEAIGYAFAQAAERQLPLTVVHVWALEFTGEVLEPLNSDLQQRALAEQEQALAAEEIAGWAEKYPDVQVRRHVLRGHPVEVLVDHSRAAELLVVGTRGRGGFRGMVLGSVSQGVLHHAHCPVAVVHPRHEASI